MQEPDSNCLKSSLQCSLCHEKYVTPSNNNNNDNNSDKFIPVTLTKCGHTFCSSCATFLTTRINPKCPIDKTNLSKTKIVNNHALINIIDDIISFEEKLKRSISHANNNHYNNTVTDSEQQLHWQLENQSPHRHCDVPICAECDVRKVSLRCEECRDSYCDECFKLVHTLLPKRKNHSSTEWQWREKVEWFECQEHKGQKLDNLVCLTCDKEMICSVCVFSTHNNHIIATIEAVIEKEKEFKFLKKNIDELTKKISHMQAKLDYNNNLNVTSSSSSTTTTNTNTAANSSSSSAKNERDIARDTVICHFKRLRDELDARERVMLSEIDKIAEDNILLLEEQQLAFSKFISFASPFINDAKEVISNLNLDSTQQAGNDMSTILKLNRTSKFIEKALKMEKEKCNSVVNIAIPVAFPPSLLVEKINDYGNVCAMNSAFKLKNVGDHVLITASHMMTKQTLIYDVKGNTFKNGPVMNYERNYHASITLEDGRVFVCGGWGENSEELKPMAMRSSEIFDPKSNSFTLAADMITAKYSHSLALLPNNQVLVIGGKIDIINNSELSSCLNSTEIYDVGTNTFVKGPNLIFHRCDFAASSLADGKIFVCGGWHRDSNCIKTTEIYDPITNSFSLGPEMRKPRGDLCATTLFDGRVLITDGEKKDGDECEIYDPKTNSFVVGPPMIFDRGIHTCSLLSDGRVFIYGHDDEKRHCNFSEFYDPQTNSFSKGPEMVDYRKTYVSSSFFFN